MELEMDRLVISSLFCFFFCLLRGSLNLVPFSAGLPYDDQVGYLGALKNFPVNA